MFLGKFMLARDARKGDMQMSGKIVVPVSENCELMEKITEWVCAKLGPNPEYDSALQPVIDEFGLPWFRAAALVVDHEGKILMMHEGKAQVKKLKSEALRDYYLNVKNRKKGDWVDEDGGWNIPAGRIMVGETFELGLRREIKEETGHECEILGILYVRWSDDYVMPTYLVRDQSGPEHHHTLETLDIHKFSPDGIRVLNEIEVLRSPGSVMNTLSAYEAYLRGEKQLNEINTWND